MDITATTKAKITFLFVFPINRKIPNSKEFVSVVINKRE